MNLQSINWEQWSRNGAGRLRFFGVPVDVIGMEEAIALAELSMKTRRPLRHTALNVAKLVQVDRDPALRRSVCESDLVTVDGQGIALGLKLFGANRVERVTGIDLFLALLDQCARHGRMPFILGSTQENLGRAVDEARRRYPGLEFAGTHHGYFDSSHEAEIVARIAQSGADCLFIAMPSPSKERFIDRYAMQMGVPFVMGVGGSIDVLAGRVARAPIWMQRIGLEWFFRLLQEPRRMFWRYASTNTTYLFRLGKALVYRQNPIQRPSADALASP